MKQILPLLALSLLYSGGVAFSQDDNEGTFQVKGAGDYVSEETAVPKSKKGVKLSEAFPEEINDKNYPDLIDTFDYPDIELKEMINIMGELTGKRFIYSDKEISGKISIISKQPISVAEAYKAFLSALQMNKLTILQSGKFLKIVKTRDAVKLNIETYSGTYFPNSDQMITKIIKLKYIPAADLDKSLRALYSQDGDLKTYEPTNSLILSDWGSNVEKIVGIIKELDVPGFEETMEVIPIKNAKAKDIADLINKIINKGEKRSSSVPRFRRSSDRSSSGKGAVSLSYVTDDERTNSIIALGNAGGLTKARELVNTLDSPLAGGQEGGVYVYYVKHNDAEEIAKTLGGIAEDSKKAQQSGGSGGRNSTPLPPTASLPKTPAQIFGSEVAVKADKNTNSLLITASPQDFNKVKGILAKIDIARDQVFVETIIMEISTDNQKRVGVDLANITPAGPATESNPAESFAVQGIFGNEGEAGLGNFIANPLAALSGGILSFGFGEEKTIQIPGGPATTVKSVLGLVRLLQTYRAGNVLSTPKIMALDNEEAEIEVGQRVTIGNTTTATAGVATTAVNREEVKTALTITPSISPASNAVRMKIKQTVQDVTSVSDVNAPINTKALTTNIVVPNGDTAVLGGLTSERQSNTTTKIPLLGDIPVLGWLFRSKSSDVVKSHLMLFITPKIIRNPANGKELLKSQIDKRLKFIKKNMNGIDPYGEKIDEISKVNPISEGDGWDEETPQELKEYPSIETE